MCVWLCTGLDNTNTACNEVSFPQGGFYADLSKCVKIDHPTGYPILLSKIGQCHIWPLGSVYDLLDRPKFVLNVCTYLVLFLSKKRARHTVSDEVWISLLGRILMVATIEPPSLPMNHPSNTKVVSVLMRACRGLMSSSGWDHRACAVFEDNAQLLLN